MKSFNLNIALIAIQVTLEEDSQEPIVNFAYAEANASGKAKKWFNVDIEDVFITGRALSKLNDPENKDCVYNQTYTSINNSKNWKLNPFSLMRKHRVDANGNDEEYYYLKCVEENGSYTKEVTLPDGNKAVERIFRPNKPSYLFKRYIDAYDKQKFYHDKRIAEAQATQ